MKLCLLDHSNAGGFNLQRVDALLFATASDALTYSRCQTDLPRDARGYEQGHSVRPGQADVLVPPALHDDRDIEAQHERHWDQIRELLAEE